jgi:fimbrial chaperone protein
MTRVAPGWLHRLLLGGALGVVLTCAGLARAGVSVSPVVVEIDSPRRPVTVTVRNTGDKPITLQSNTMSWQQPDGSDRYEATSDIMVVPAIAQIAAGASQVFRVALRTAPTGVERAYRLILEDVSQELSTADQQSRTVAVRFNHDLPVLVAPSRPAPPALQWKPCSAPAAVAALPAASDTARAPAASSYACVTLRNAGNRRVRVSTLRLAGDGWDQAVQLPAPQVVLAGGQRSWRVPLRSAAAGQLRTVRADLETGALQAEPATF